MSDAVHIPDAYRLSGAAMVALDAIARGERADRRVLKALVRIGLALDGRSAECLTEAGWVVLGWIQFHDDKDAQWLAACREVARLKNEVERLKSRLS